MPTTAPAPASERDVDVGGRPRAGSAHSSALGRYHTGLDGLRGVGMCAVLAYHGGVAGVPGAYLALSQFFTLSGFLVAAMLLRAHDRGGIGLRSFWIRRVRRLVPASVVAMAGIVLFGMFVATPAQAETLPTHLAAAALWVANWYSIFADQSYVDLFAAPSPVDHFWSLSLEEQFYLGMSVGMVLLLRVADRTRHIVAALGVVAAASLAWTIHLTAAGAPIDRVYLGTDTRLTEILLGSILAVLVVRGVLRPGPKAQHTLGWAALVAYAVSLWMWHTVPLDSEVVWGSGGIAAYAGLTVLVILGVLSDRGPLAAFLAWWPLAALGRISYGTYLYHWPIFLWLTEDRTGLDGPTLLALRVATTMALAVASYHLLEVPIRNGATLHLPRRGRYLAVPVCSAIVVVAAVVVVDSDGPDDTVTFADDASTDAPPGAGDPVLDVLVMGDAGAGPIVAHMVATGEADAEIDVADGGTFACSRLQRGAEGWTCPEWAEDWGALVEEHDPDAVVFMVDDWTTDELQALVDQAGGGAEPLDVVAEQALGAGFDRLVERGASVTWAVSRAPLEELEQRASLPFHQAMAHLLQQRSDLHPSPWLPLRRDPMGGPYLERVSTTVLDAVSATRRREGEGLPRILVVGDSTARSVGYGLEQDAAERGDVLVWNVAVGGCGIAQDGIAIDFRTEAELAPDPDCVDAVSRWPDNVADFDPDVVLVLSGLLDAQDRDLEGDGTFAVPGEATLDQYLLETYLAASDALGAGGAMVVWLSPPCVQPLAVLGSDSGLGEGVFDPERMDALRAVVDRLPAERPGTVEVYDLDAVLCPGGEFLESADGVDEIRPDGLHLSVEGSLWLAERLRRDLLDGLLPDAG